MLWIYKPVNFSSPCLSAPALYRDKSIWRCASRAEARQRYPYCWFSFDPRDALCCIQFVTNLRVNISAVWAAAELVWSSLQCFRNIMSNINTIASRDFAEKNHRRYDGDRQTALCFRSAVDVRAVLGPRGVWNSTISVRYQSASSQTDFLTDPCSQNMSKTVLSKMSCHIFQHALSVQHIRHLGLGF